MNKIYKKSLFIFRRDLRLEDNTALIRALSESKEVIPLFIFTPRQAYKENNEYFSKHGFQFLLACLKDVEERISKRGGKLFYCEGKPREIVKECIEEEKIEAVYINEDYTPYARERDDELKMLCDENNIDFHCCLDSLLCDPRKIMTNENKPYSVFTPFMNKAKGVCSIDEPVSNGYSNFYSKDLSIDTVVLDSYKQGAEKDLFKNGGREEALEILRSLQELQEYSKQRNMVVEEGTSGLSPHHRHGTISIRETYHVAKEIFGETSQFISELYWRDFYTYIAFHFPRVLGGMVGEENEAFQERGRNISWSDDDDHFERWKEGKTGVPLVDAGMRQLNTIGWMHNRARMTVASYVTKDLLIDWRKGERYFATKLIDYDPAVNNGNWQWSASIGADPKPLRIFNPYTQASKYDPHAEYIKKWVPELKGVDSSKLTDGKERDFSELADEYVSPLVNHNEAYHRAKDIYREAKENL